MQVLFGVNIICKRRYNCQRTDQKKAEKPDDDPMIQSGFISVVGASSAQAGGADSEPAKELPIQTWMLP